MDAEVAPRLLHLRSQAQVVEQFLELLLSGLAEHPHSVSVLRCACQRACHLRTHALTPSSCRVSETCSARSVRP